MKRHIVSLAVIVAIAVTWYVWRQHALNPAVRSHATAVAPAATAVTAANASTASGSAKAPPHIRRISTEDRQRLVEQITAARAVREAHAAHAESSGTGSAPALPEDDHTHDLDHVSPSVRDALNAAIPFLAACYEARGSGQPPADKTAVVQLTLTNDPEIGAVIDTDQLHDDHDAPLAPELDACLRGTIQTLQLPPLDAGDRVKLQYSFNFADAPKK